MKVARLDKKNARLVFVGVTASSVWESEGVRLYDSMTIKTQSRVGGSLVTMTVSRFFPFWLLFVSSPNYIRLKRDRLIITLSFDPPFSNYE